MTQPTADTLLAELADVLVRNPEMPFAQYVVQLPGQGGMYHVTLTRPGESPPQERLVARSAELVLAHEQISIHQAAVTELTSALGLLQRTIEATGESQRNLELRVQDSMDSLRGELESATHAYRAGADELREQLGGQIAAVDTWITERLRVLNEQLMDQFGVLESEAKGYARTERVSEEIAVVKVAIDEQNAHTEKVDRRISATSEEVAALKVATDKENANIHIQLATIRTELQDSQSKLADELRILIGESVATLLKNKIELEAGLKFLSEKVNAEDRHLGDLIQTLELRLGKTLGQEIAALRNADTQIIESLRAMDVSIRERLESNADVIKDQGNRLDLLSGGLEGEIIEEVDRATGALRSDLDGLVQRLSDLVIHGKQLASLSDTTKELTREVNLLKVAVGVDHESLTFQSLGAEALDQRLTQLTTYVAGTEGKVATVAQQVNDLRNGFLQEVARREAAERQVSSLRESAAHTEALVAAARGIADLLRGSAMTMLLPEAQALIDAMDRYES